MEAADPTHWRGVAAAVELARQGGARVIFTNGCFDLMHPGHVHVLRAARDLGDLLVVGVNSDASVRRLKGEGRPVMPLPERMEMLAAVRWVSHVVAFDDDTPARLLQTLRPDVVAKGADWKGRKLPESAVLEAIGARVAFIRLAGAHSTTALLARIRGQCSEP